MEAQMSAEDTLLTEVRDSIEKALPAMQANAFRKYIEEVEKRKKDYQELVDDQKKLTDKCDAMNKELIVLRDLKLEAGIIKREKEELDLNKKRFEIEKQLQMATAIHAEEKVTLVSSLFHDVFRNIDIRRNVLGSIPVINKCPDGNQYVTHENSDTTETETKE